MVKWATYNCLMIGSTPSETTRMEKYKIVSNWCNCHPETCCCKDYVIVDEKGSKVITVNTKKEGKVYIAGIKTMGITGFDQV